MSPSTLRSSWGLFMAVDVVQRSNRGGPWCARSSASLLPERHGIRTIGTRDVKMYTCFDLSYIEVYADGGKRPQA